MKITYVQGLRISTIKAYAIGMVTVFIFGFLFWEHFHGGVTSHHLLHNKDLPSISNWWSGLLLPILTWFLLGRIEKRIEVQSSQAEPSDVSIRKIVWLFLAGLIIGILLSVSFANAFKPFLDNVLYVLIALSFFIPIFYAEFILGFILGMTITFGAILPTAFMLIMAGVGLVTYRFIRPLVLRLVTKIGGR